VDIQLVQHLVEVVIQPVHHPMEVDSQLVHHLTALDSQLAQQMVVDSLHQLEDIQLLFHWV
jgi:hypothetical protein